MLGDWIGETYYVSHTTEVYYSLRVNEVNKLACDFLFMKKT